MRWHAGERRRTAPEVNAGSTRHRPAHSRRAARVWIWCGGDWRDDPRRRRVSSGKL